MDGRARYREHVDLRVAASVVYSQVTGRRVRGERDPRTLRVLNDVARALASVAPIWVSESDSRVRQVDASELVQGRFESGAMLLRKNDGGELRRLTVQRGDMLSAIALIRAAKLDFRD
jgi:hypothetical protein